MGKNMCTVITFIIFLSVPALCQFYTFTFNPTLGQQQVVGTSVVYTVTADPANPDVTLSFSPTSDYAVYPSELDFSSTPPVSSLNVTFQATTVGSILVATSVSGSDAIYYASPSTYKSIISRTLDFSAGYATFPTYAPILGVPTNSFALGLSLAPTNPLTVSIAADPAGAITFSPNSFVFTASSSQPYPFTYDAATTGNGGDVTIYFTFSGTDEAWYDATNYTVTPTPRQVIPSDAYTTATPVGVGQQSQAIRLSLNYPPPSDVTLTPYSSSMSFVPNMLQFTPTASSIQFTYTSTSAGPQVISWTLTGTDAALYADLPNKTVTIDSFSFVVTGPSSYSYGVGQTSGLFTVSTQYPPSSALTVTLSLTSTCTLGQATLTTSVLTFTSTTLSNTFAVSSSVVCSSVVLTATVSGTGASLYAAPVFPAALAFNKLTVSSIVNIDPTFTGVLHCGDTTSYSQTVTSPPPNGFSVQLSAPGATFMPSILMFTPTNLIATFTVTANYEQSQIAISYTVSGTDKLLVNPIATNYISVAAKTVTAPYSFATAGSNLLFAGSTSSPAAVTLNYPPATGLTITPTATGINFSPPSLVFTSTTTSLELSASGATAGAYTATFTLSGDDAGCYSITSSPSITITVSKANIQMTPSYFSALAVGTSSPPYTLAVNNLASAITITPVAEDVNSNPVLGVYSFLPPTISLTQQNPSTSFTYSLSSSRPTSDKIVFQVSGAAASTVSPLTVNLGTSQLRTFTMPQYLSSSAVGSFAPATFVQNFASPSFVVTIANAPPTDVSLLPFAPNTIFSPNVLQFDPNTTSVSFTVQSTDGSGIVASGGIVKTISWTVQGTDAALYQTPTSSGYVAVKRNIMVSQTSSLTNTAVYVNTPLSFTVITPYAPESALTITLSAGSAITLSATSITLDSSTQFAVFTATPNIVGTNLPIQFVINGDPIVVSEYVTIPNVLLSTKQAGFIVTSTLPSSTLVYGVDTYVYTIRPQISPPTSVTISVFSSQVTVEPSSYTFTPGDVSQDFYVKPVLAAFTNYVPSEVAFTFVVNGTDADLYATPAGVTFAAQLSTPLRTLTVTPSYLYVATGQSSSFTVGSSVPPENSITITPSTPWENDYMFSPPFVTLTSSSPIATFSVSRSGNLLPIDTSYLPIVFGISGPDAYYYSDPATTIIYPISGTIITSQIVENMQLVVNQGLTSTISLSLPPSDRLSISPMVVAGGQPVSFSPTEITFMPGELSTTFTITGEGVGTSRIGFFLSGPAASAYAPKADIDLTIIAGSVSFSNNWVFSVGGQAKTGYVSLNTPVLNGLTLTLTGAGLTFSPPVISFEPGAVTASFTVTITASGISGYLTSVLGGPDGEAGLFTNPYPYPELVQYSSAQGTVTASYSASASTYFEQIVYFYFTPAPQVFPLIINPYGPPNSNLTFIPSSVSISEIGTTTATVNVISTTPGPVNVYYILSGLGASYYTIQNMYSSPITPTFYAYPLTVTSSLATNVVIGIPSTLYVISAPTPVAPVGTAYITFSASVPGVDFLPPSVVINTTSPVASFAYRSNATIGSINIGFTISGPGASAYLPITPITVYASLASFTIPSFYNLVTPNGYPFVYGVQSQSYVISARSVPQEVWIQLASNGVSFSPSILHFTPTNQQASFTFTPTQVGTAVITYTLLGNSTSLYSTPATTTISVTYNVNFPQIPTVSVGHSIGGYSVSIQPAPTSSFILNLAASGSVVFSPAALVFAPGVTSQQFSVTGLSPTIYRPTYTLPGTTPQSPPGSATVSLTGTDGSDGTLRYIPLAQSAAIIVAPGTFTILHPRYQLDVKAKISISISVAPRSDVIITLLANNINFDNAPYAVFTRGGPTTQELDVIPRHTTSYELDYASFKVDYVLSGTNAGDYFAPSETLHYFALPMGYIAAIILVPLAVAFIIIVIIVVLKKHGEKSSRTSVSVN